MSDRFDNVLLLTIDCLRADHFSTREWDVFPDEVSTISFEECIGTGPGTSTAFPGILFSSYPLEYGGYGKITENRKSIAEVLRQNDISTAGFHSNPLLAESVGYGQGFETFYDSIGSKRQLNELLGSVFPDFLHRLVKRVYFRSTGYQELPYDRAEEINERIMRWLDGRNTGWFCWAHYMDPHHPYKPPAEYTDIVEDTINDLWHQMNNRPEGITESEVETLKDLYKSEIQYLCNELKDLFSVLNERGQMSNTLIVLLADHGEAFREHGQLVHPPELYDELIHVPLAFASPSFSKSENISSLVSTVDVAPTILSLVDCEIPSSYQGTPIFSPDYDRDGAFSELSHRSGGGGEVKPREVRVSYRTFQWKYILDRQTRQDELYNLVEDPNEKYNIIDSNARIADDFQSIIDKHLHEIVNDRSERRESVNDSVEQRLSDLGYR